MTAENPGRRTMTAREAAARFGVHPRTIQRFAAEPRSEFEKRAKERRETARKLRAEGKKYEEIAQIMGISSGAVGGLLHIVKQEQGAA